MSDFESGYNAFNSRFGSDKASTQRGSFARFLEEGQGNLSQFAGSLGNTFNAPSGTNAQEESAYADAGDARNVEQWGDNLSRVNQQYDQSAQIGFSGVQQLQQVQQAKEMAKLNAQSAQQGAMWSGISSGLSALGSIGGAAKSGNWFGGGESGASGATHTLPSASNWKTGSGSFRYF